MAKREKVQASENESPEADTPKIPAEKVSTEEQRVQADKKRPVKRNRKKGKKRGKQATDAEEGEVENKPTPAVVYLGHIPHGFYEREMRGYFNQFGEVKKLRLSRSLKSGRSRGFAFIEFADENVAEMAAKSMDGYLMHGVRMVSSVVPKEKQHRRMFLSKIRPTRKFVPRSVQDRKALIKRSSDPTKVAERSRNIKKNLLKKKARLDKLKLKYKFPTIPTQADEQRN